MKEYKYIINGNKYNVVIDETDADTVTVTVNGEEYKVEKEKAPELEKKKVVVKPAAPAAKPAADAAASPAPKGSSGKINVNNALKAPLPGVVTEVKVNVGDEVKAGDTVVVLEAMKMANNLEAERGGKVTAVLVKAGDSVMEDTPLVVIE